MPGVPAPCFIACDNMMSQRTPVNNACHRAKMTFVEITDRLMANNVGLRVIAEALNVSYSTVRATRLPAASSSYRDPPKGWERALAKLTRERIAELVKLAEELEG